MPSSKFLVLCAIPFYILLLPVFFVLHGYTEFYNLIRLTDAIKLTGIYLAGVLILYCMVWPFFRDRFKTSFFVFLLMSFNFFFGPVHDSVKKNFPGLFISHYSFILSVTIIFFICCFWVLKKIRNKSVRLSFYLNSLFIVLLLFDAFRLIVKSNSLPSTYKFELTKELVSCKDCLKPDIYLIVADGYAGKQELKDIFNYDNSSFENELAKRDFYVVAGTNGNYNFTPFIIASMLNMGYLEGLEGSNTSKKDMQICFSSIKKNKVLQYLKSEGYDFYNYSIFDIDNLPSLSKPTFLATKTRPITSQTFLYRIQRDLWYHLVTDLKLKFARNAVVYRDLRNNNKLTQLTMQVVNTKDTDPKFIYTHLVMPHYPYYFDSTGKEMPYEKLGYAHNNNKETYVSYLKYCNKKLLELTDYILANSKKPPIIILMSDHGFREFDNPIEKKYYFMNFNAVHLPNKNYTAFYDSMSNVNQFRAILNTQFKQSLPLLKDSTSFLRQ